jgi:hypothetical protein
VLLERELLWCGPAPASIVLPRAAALALAELRRLGFVTVLLDHDREPVRDAQALLRLHDRIAAAVVASGGRLEGAFAYPRPGEDLDPGVPRPSVFARLVLEAATQLRLDLPRSTVLAASLDAVEGARIAGVSGALVGVPDTVLAEAVRDRPAARPDQRFADVGAARAAIVAARQRCIAQGF